MADDKGKKDESEAVPVDPNEGPGKGKAFFDRAKTVASTGNYDYAIDMYIEGLNREPFNVEEHKALREVGFNRKIKGGKPAGGLMGPKLPYKGKTPKDAMLNHSFLLAKDLGNIPSMLAIIRNAVILGHKDVVLWIGQILREANRTNKTPKVEIYMELADIYAKLEEYYKASEAIQGAIELKPTDGDLVTRAKDYSAQETLKKGNYEKGESFQGSIKDMAATKKLLQEDNLSKSEEYRSAALVQAKSDYEKNPRELQVIAKYAKALVDMETEEHENIAMEMLKQAYADTRIYRLKAGIGDIRMRQFKRALRLLIEKVKANPADKDSLHQYEELNKQRLAFEVEEFLERSEHMPTDLLVKYDLGVRMWESGRYDDAIVAFQEAQQHPKHRVKSMHFLGRSFLTQGMKPEAVETLKRSIDEYDLAQTGNPLSMDLHYWYARALEANGDIREAIDVYSKIVRWQIAYLDARKRMEELRKRLDGGTPPAQ